MFLHLIVVGWAIFTAVFSFQLVQIFLYGQEKIALVDIRNIPVLLVLIGIPLIPITIHSFKKLTSAEKTYWSWFCLFGVYGIFVLALRECPAYTLLYQFSPKDTGQSKVK